MSGFKSVFYDGSNNKIYHWWFDDDGKTHKEELHPVLEYYIPDRSGKSDIKDIYGNPVILQTSETIAGMRAVAEAMKTCESDLPEDVKYLQKFYKGKNLKVDIDQINVATIDIELEISTGFNEEEQKQAKYPINLLSVHFSKTNQLYTFGIRPYTGNSEVIKNYIYAPDEKKMLEEFIELFRKQRVSVLTGFYSRSFDIPYIINRCEVLGIEKSLSPINIYKKKHYSGYHIDEGDGYTIAGIAILDGVDLYKNYEKDKLASYSLQNVGMLVVGEGKKDYEGTINTAWKVNWNAFVEYNAQDVILVKKIEDVKKYIPLTINLCYQALIPFDRIFSTVSLVEGYVLKYLHNENMVMPDRDKNQEVQKLPGAYVYAKPGAYKNCITYDVESLYPHMIILNNISPETLKMNDDKYGKTPLSEYKIWETKNGEKEYGGVYYDRSKQGIISKVTEQIINDRKKFKQKMFIADAIKNGRDLLKYDSNLVKEVQQEKETTEYYDGQQYTRKILANCQFGCVSCEYFHLYNFYNALTITLGGQHLIRYLTSSFDKYMTEQFHLNIKKYYPDFKGEFKPLTNKPTIQIDTDSSIICLDEVINNLGIKLETNQQLYDWMIEFDKKLAKPLFDKLLKMYADNFGVKQIINFKREKIITQKITLAMKKYIDEIIADEDKLYIDKPKLKPIGVEIVRTDTPKFCRSELKNVVNAIFETKMKDKSAIISEIIKIKDKFIKSNITDISIPKGVSDYDKYAKPVDEYLKHGIVYPSGCPIHNRAAINYNYMIKKHNIPAQPIYNGTKLKYIHVVDRKNEIHQNVIGFIGTWPEEFNNLFVIDYETQWNRVFTTIIQRFFDVLKWGNIELEGNDMASFIQF